MMKRSPVKLPMTDNRRFIRSSIEVKQYDRIGFFA